jgi:hypothetical protein
VLAVAVAACGGSPLPATFGIAVGATVHPEPPIEIYSRIASGALKCWFGPAGSLKKTHVFHAEVAPPSAGGEAEIVIHERDKAATSPRSLRSYQISVTRSGDGSAVRFENLRFPEAVAKDLGADVVRWAAGGSDCSVVGVGGWAPAPPPTTASTKAAKTPVKKKQP